MRGFLTRHVRTTTGASAPVVVDDARELPSVHPGQRGFIRAGLKIQRIPTVTVHECNGLSGAIAAVGSRLRPAGSCHWPRRWGASTPVGCNWSPDGIRVRALVSTWTLRRWQYGFRGNHFRGQVPCMTQSFRGTSHAIGCRSVESWRFNRLELPVVSALSPVVKP